MNDETRTADALDLVQRRLLDRPNELVYFERLSEDASRAEQTPDFAPVRPCAHDDDRHVTGIRPPLAPARDELRAIEVGEAEVEHHGGGLARERGAKRLRPVHRGNHVEPHVAQGPGDQATDVGIVLDKKDTSM